MKLFTICPHCGDQHIALDREVETHICTCVSCEREFSLRRGVELFENRGLRVTRVPVDQQVKAMPETIVVKIPANIAAKLLMLPEGVVIADVTLLKQTGLDELHLVCKRPEPPAELLK